MDAQHFFEQACETIPSLLRLKKVPETEKGDDVFWTSDHVLSLLRTIDVPPAENHIDDPIIRLALFDARRALALAPDLFRAYALMHDVAKPDRILLIAKPGTKGEAEGFLPASRRSQSYSSESEIVRFDKFRRAHALSDVTATFDDADRAVIAPQYAKEREAIVTFCGLDTAHVKFVAELCWSHKDALTLFDLAGNESAFSVFPARAGKAGLNVGRFLDSLLAIVWLEGGLSAFHRFVRAEYAVMPERHAEREARERHGKKLRIKAILGESGLDPEKLFVELSVPLGPERGRIMEKMYAVIRGESDASDFGAFAHSLEDRATKARELLAKEALSV